MAIGTLFCPICGAKFVQPDPENPDLPNNWLSDFKILYLNPDEIARQSEPIILSTSARLPDTEWAWPQVWDEARGVYTTLGSELFKNDGTTANSFCYPIHDLCLSVFRELISTCGIDFRPEFFSLTFVIFGGLSYDWQQLYWPSEYGGISEYQKAVRERWNHIPPKYEYVEAAPVGIAYLRKRLDEEREILQIEVSAGGTHDTYETVPDFLPIPAELVHLIMGFLEWSDIKNLQKIKCNKEIEIPDIMWRDSFDVTEDFGFFAYTEDDASIKSWYQLHKLANRLFEHEIPGVKNRQRIWRLCVESFIMSSHIAIEESFEIEDATEKSKTIEVDDPTSLLCVQATSIEELLSPTLFDGVPTRYSSTLTDVVATGMYVSFKGIGRLRFVSGFKFMPSEKSIGNLNRFDNSFVSFESGTQNSILTMHIAANKNGIVDISVVSSRSTSPEPIWLGGTDLTGCAITRWNIRSGGSGLILAQIILDLNSISITKLQMLRPNFISSPNLTPEEVFIQQNLWKPLLPVLGADSCLNHEMFYSSELRSSNLVNERSDQHVYAEFDPLECIYSDETLTRLSIWTTGLYNDICAIELYTKERQFTPHVVGTPMGAATDIFLDSQGGEYLSYMGAIVVEDTGKIIGVSFFTSYNRKFEMAFQEDGQFGWIPGQKAATCTVDLCPKDATMITGIYCRFSQRRIETTLLDIGVITTKIHLDKWFRSPWLALQRLAIDSKESEPVNSQLISLYKRIQDIPQRCTAAIGNGWKFISKIPVKGCNKIVAYIQADHPFRLSGLCAYYDDLEHPKLPKVLGQIGHATTTEAMKLSPSEGEVIKAITVFYRQLYGEKPLGVVGLRVQTTKARDPKHHRRRDFGECKADGISESRKLKFLDFNYLMWEYTEHGDHLSVTI